jgi:hypothetical protein
VVAFLIGSATLGLDGLLLSLRLLGPRWAAARALGAIAVAFTGAWLVGDRAAASPRRDGHAPHEPRGDGLLAAPLRALDQRGAWYLLGLLGAAALESQLPAGSLAGTLGAWVALVGIAISLPLHAALIAIVPGCAVLVHKGMSPTAVLAIALIAPALHWHALRLVAVGGRDAAARVLAGVIVAGAAVALASAPAIPSTSLPPMHALLLRGLHPIEWIAAAVLAVGLLVSLLRLGPRLWLGQIALLGEPAEEHEHAH